MHRLGWIGCKQAKVFNQRSEDDEDHKFFIFLFFSKTSWYDILKQIQDGGDGYLAYYSVSGIGYIPVSYHIAGSTVSCYFC